MKLISINVAQPKDVLHNSQVVKTGIFKQPLQGRVMVRTLNIDGDGQGDARVHGGIYKAVYAYPVEHYDHWKHELGRDDLTYGKFGENLTVEGMREDSVHIGDVFRVGKALVQVTQPRVPCFKLGIKMDMLEFPKQFLASRKVGFYLRVLEEGEIEAGDSIEKISIDPQQMTVRTILHLRYFDKTDREGIKDAVQLEALAPAWREPFEKILAGTLE